MWNWGDIIEKCRQLFQTKSEGEEAENAIRKAWEEAARAEEKKMSMMKKWNNMGKMRILVISDTHRNVRKIEEVMKQEEKVDLVLHMGDLEGHGEYIRQVTGCPLEAVRGNCDYDGQYPVNHVIEVGGHVIFMTHGHCYGVEYDLEELKDMAKGCGADIVMYGHTHKPYFQQMKDDIVILNPGSLGYPRQDPRKSSYMIMEADTDTGEIKYHQRCLKGAEEARFF